MASLADYIKSLIQDRDNYKNNLNTLFNISVTENSFTNLNEILVDNYLNSYPGLISYKFYPGDTIKENELALLSLDNLTNLHQMFYQCENIQTLNLSQLNVSNVTDMAYLFSYCSNLKTLDITGWNTANVTNMTFMFQYCANITNFEMLSSLNISKINSMAYMFRACNNITNLHFMSNWNTNNIDNMSQIFYSCSNLTDLGISNWNMSKVTNVTRMFAQCNNLSDNALKDIANICLNATNVTRKSLNASNRYSPISLTNKSLTVDNIGEDLYNKLLSNGWTF